MKKPQILVVGSCVMDLVTRLKKIPGSGETVLGEHFTTASGGKGANQAVQAARLGACVTMVGKVGDDAFGREMRSSLAASGVDVTYLMTQPDQASGVGNILLETGSNGASQNRITVVPGANMTISPWEVEFLEEQISGYDLVMLQLEIPMDINVLISRYAKNKGVPVMLNSAPSAPLPRELVENLTYISPNEHEAADLTGIPIRQGPEMMDDARRAVSRLLEMGVENVIITLGSNGAVLGNKREWIAADCVTMPKVEDPTAAGDSFVASFCTGVCAGLDHRQALTFASYTAALTVSRLGAQPSLPTLAEVISLMKQRGCETVQWEKLDALM